jgi:hypothetical protein
LICSLRAAARSHDFLSRKAAGIYPEDCGRKSKNRVKPKKDIEDVKGEKSKRPWEKGKRQLGWVVPGSWEHRAADRQSLMVELEVENAALFRRR